MVGRGRPVPIALGRWSNHVCVHRDLVLVGQFVEDGPLLSDMNHGILGG